MPRRAQRRRSPPAVARRPSGGGAVGGLGGLGDGLLDLLALGPVQFGILGLADRSVRGGALQRLVEDLLGGARVVLHGARGCHRVRRAVDLGDDVGRGTSLLRRAGLALLLLAGLLPVLRRCGGLAAGGGLSAL